MFVSYTYQWNRFLYWTTKNSTVIPGQVSFLLPFINFNPSMDKLGMDK